MLNQTLANEKSSIALHAEGNRLLNARGEAVRLIGVNCAGLEWRADGDLILERCAMAFDEWKANLIRLPMSQDRWFGYGSDQEDDRSGEAYRSLIDEVMNMAAERGKYIILNLQWSDAGVWGQNIKIHNVPDANSVTFWHDAASRYANHPSVLCGLYNESHDAPWDIWQSGGYVEQEGFPGVGMQTLINTIRNRGAKNLIVAGGVDWAYDLRGVEEHPLADRGGNGIMYDSHVYPWKPAPYEKYIPASLTAKYPIIIGECGHHGDKENVREGKQRSPYAEWIPELLAYIDANSYHACAWDFHPKAGPCLIADYEGTPTAHWGVFWKEFLAKHNGP